VIDYEEDDDDFEESVEALSGAADGVGPPPLAELLLTMTSMAVRATVLLCEADEAEFELIRHRLAVVQKCVADLPTEPTRKRKSRRRVGFR
jgi:hypothetical protein